jgi:cell division protein FtsB
MVVLGVGVSGGAVRHYWMRRQELTRLEERRAELARRVRDLEARSARAEEDDLFLEMAARRELGVIGPGEIDFRFVDDPPTH